MFFATRKAEESQMLLHCWYTVEDVFLSKEAIWATDKLHVPLGTSHKLAANLLQAYSQSNVMFGRPHSFLRG